MAWVSRVGGGGGVADTLHPLSTSAAESNRVFFLLFGPIPHLPVTDYPGMRWAVLQADYTVVFAGKRHLRNKRSEASAVMVKLKKARSIGRI